MGRFGGIFGAFLGHFLGASHLLAIFVLFGWFSSVSLNFFDFSSMVKVSTVFLHCATRFALAVISEESSALLSWLEIGVSAGKMKT